ncbi:MAG: AEC family transporter [Desulfamplus sp.]|nr:AEC family transporter [Desulfamplus sp.]
MQIVSTIIPIFLIISLGWFIRRRDFMPNLFLAPANKIVYYIAIPAMIFSAVAKASFHEEFNITILLITFSSLILTAISAWLITLSSKMTQKSKGTFIQSAFHGNFGYIGLAVVFYYLGDSGFANASIFSGFIMILQNMMAVAILQPNFINGNNGSVTVKRVDLLTANFKAIVRHPIIISALCGMIFSLFEIALPMIVDRTLSILSGMALPLALLLIGATISFKVIHYYLLEIIEISLLKLVLMPGIGVLFFNFFSIPASEYLPVLILLASPTATMVYVMAQEMDGDTDFAVAALSACTIFSAITFTFWLNLLS